MKTFSLLLSFFLIALLHFGLNAQNLVPNPSFEDTVACPDNFGQIDKAANWYSFGQTPDYLNSCGIVGGSGVPVNFGGYQVSSNGNAYIGIYNSYPPYTLYREYAGAHLLTPLLVGTKYYLSFKINMANNSSAASNNMGVLFSTVSYSTFNSVPIVNHAQLYCTSIISDTSHWINIAGSFIADSAFQYIIAGNFFSDSNTNFNNTFWNPDYLSISYYYIDDVCVSADSATCNSETGVKSISTSPFNIYPNPANNKIYFSNNPQNEFDCSLINMLGEVVGTYPSTRANSIDVSTIPEGIYLLQLKFRNQLIQKRQIILH